MPGHTPDCINSESGTPQAFYTLSRATEQINFKNISLQRLKTATLARNSAATPPLRSHGAPLRTRRTGSLAR
ncbi:hypothetical protein KL86DES1_10797 [uncultured Desulfovibrio sp.]|uniref:Uncharacterized protein n=1 Tax=uncultured Desulfovibrio sp. TaxID=167968 RepID=A0A212L0H6_9BACT|nr:hypothetical protein KL86DES1_10797 [uncultured Desulfovibrio sp.]